MKNWKHIYSGKVRDLYEHESDDRFLLIVASNRVSAFDFALEPEIPGKGALLTELSKWWFDRLDVPNQLATDGPAAPAEVAERATVARKLEMLPIECVVRGVLTGSGFKEYQETGAVCGIELPAGLKDGDFLESPIYTPAYKAPLGEHDENITFERTVELVGAETAAKLRELSLAIFATARKEASDRDLILADTKFEFGVDPVTREIVLADEVLTSDSSRYLDAETRASFDKQIVRDWLKTNWDGEGTPPVLPQEIVQKTRARYALLRDRFIA